MIAFSTPIWDADDEFQGVIGVFIELGDLIRNLESWTPEEEDVRSMSVLDARQGLKEARLIHDSNQAIKDFRTVDLSSLGESYPEQRIKIKPVELRDVSKSGLFVLMREPSETIEAPGKRLGANLEIIGLSVVGFAALVLIVTWIIILQRVVKT